jgi:hypothetical protein
MPPRCLHLPGPLVEVSLSRFDDRVHRIALERALRRLEQFNG